MNRAASATTWRACEESPLLAIAAASASRHHAVTSSIAAPAIASAPTGRLSIRRSIRIRASTGKAVTDIATPMKSAKGR